MHRPSILLLIILLHAAASFPSDRKARDKQASWDDVNVVAHGLLQLGQGLKEHVDKTKAQMRDVNAKLKGLNSTLANLEKKQHEQEEALKARSKELEERERLAEEVKKYAEEVNSRMDRLEEMLTEPSLESDDSKHTWVPFIQRLVVAQNRRIDELVEKIRQQQDKLEKQSVYLQARQSKVGHKRVKSHRRRDEETSLRGKAKQIITETDLARDCHDLFVRGQRTSGVYTIQPQNSQPFNVLCEMTSEGGWTVIQKRQDGSENFNQLWEIYRKGFGSLNGEFWLGLDSIHSLSKQGRYILQVEVSNETGQQKAGQYQFQLDGEEKKFALHLEQESSSGLQENLVTTGDAGLPFSTADQDNDRSADVNCAKLLSGGWWFSSCGESNLNGRYPKSPSPRKQSRGHVMFWTTTKGQSDSLTTTLMKIAPAAIQQ
ncbi:angiopoietin-related protein 4-like [Pholidichthys leucotaenia]